MTKLSLAKKSGLATAIALTCILAAQAAAPLAQTPFERANLALAAAATPQGKADALADIEHAMNEGDGRAAMRLAELSLQDIGFAGDLAYERALRFYGRAVELDADRARVAQALTLTRRGYYQGKETEAGKKTLSGAIALLQATADSGDREVLWNLGFLETTGLAGPRDVNAGSRHIEDAALAGHGLAALWAANRYGAAIPAEPEMERRFLATAAAANIRGAQERLDALDARIHARAPVDLASTAYGSVLTTSSVVVSTAKFPAKQDLPTVAAGAPYAPTGSHPSGGGGGSSGGDIDELAALRSRLDQATRERDQLQQQLAEARERAERLSRGGLSTADLAALNSQGLEAVVEGNYEIAIARFRQAAAANYAPAQSNLGLMYLNSTGVPRDVRQAAKLFELAARQGNVTASENLARIYDFGIGIHRDRSRAIKWYEHAQSLGSTFAGSAIERLKSH